MARGWKPRITLLAAESSGLPPDGIYIYHDFIRYGPWNGTHEDGAEVDLWDAHDWALANLGLCVFHNGLRPCDDDCRRPGWQKNRRQAQRDAQPPPDVYVQRALRGLMERL